MSLNEILFALTCPAFSMHLKTYQQNALEKLDHWIEALKDACLRLQIVIEGF